MISFQEIDLWVETFYPTALASWAHTDRGQTKKKQVRMWRLLIKPVFKAPRETPLPSSSQWCRWMKAKKKKNHTKKCVPVMHTKPRLKEDFPRTNQRGAVKGNVASYVK